MDDDLKKLIGNLIDEIRDMNKSKSGATFEYRDSKKLADDLTYLKKRTENLTESIKKANEKSMSFTKMLAPIPGTLMSVKDELEALDDAISTAKDNTEKRELEAKRSALRDEAAKADNIELLKKFGVSLSSSVKAGATGVGTFVKGLQSGQSGIQLASGLMEASLDIAGSTSAALGQAAGSAGQVMMTSTNPKLKALGAVAAVVGPALGMLGENASKLAKFGVEVLSKEVEKTVNAFNQASASGAMFANGMDDLRKYSGQAGLTVDQFSNVIKNNAQVLAESGYTVSGGAKIVAGITSNLATQTGKSGLKLQTELLNLGYGFEEQADIVAQMTGDLKKTGGTATNAQMAQATVEMGKNMRTVADLMGEDAKAKMDQAKKMSEQYAFFAKVNEIAKRTNDPGLPGRVRASMAMMDETQQRAAIQATVLGGAVTDVAANLTGMADPAREFANNLQNGNAGVKDLVGGFAKANDNLTESSGGMMEAISRGAIAGADGLQGLAKSVDSLGQSQYKLTTANLDQAQKNVQESSAANGDLQKSVMSAETAAQDLKLSLQNELTPAIKEFATVSKEMLNGVRKMMKEAGIGEGGAKTGPGIMDRLSSAGSSAVNWGSTAAVAGTVLAPETMGMSELAVPLAALAGAVKGFFDVPGYASGGIMSADKSGTPTMLHGTEAIVPLPDGKSIPVTMGGSASASLPDGQSMLSTLSNPMKELSNTLSQMVVQITDSKASKETSGGVITSSAPPDMSENFNKLNELVAQQLEHQKEMIFQLKDHKDISQKILYASS